MCTPSLCMHAHDVDMRNTYARKYYTHACAYTHNQLILSPSHTVISNQGLHDLYDQEDVHQHVYVNMCRHTCTLTHTHTHDIHRVHAQSLYTHTYIHAKRTHTYIHMTCPHACNHTKVHTYNMHTHTHTHQAQHIKVYKKRRRSTRMRTCVGKATHVRIEKSSII
jgi:hypothetical protein